MYSTSSSVRRVPSAEEEEEPDNTTLRYVPRTLLQGGPFYGSTIQNKSADNLRGTNKKGSKKSTRLGRSKSASEQNLHKESCPRFQHASTDNITNTSLNLSSSRPYEENNDHGSVDIEAGKSQSSRSTPEPHTKHIDLDDIDIKSIHGEDHFGKLETTPITDHQDRLWTQIDALDDVKKLASSVNLYEGFPPAFEEQLGKLRHAHSRLLRLMRDRDAILEDDKNFYRTDSESTKGHSTRMGKALGGSMSRVVGHTTDDHEDNADENPDHSGNMGDATNISNLSIDPNGARVTDNRTSDFNASNMNTPNINGVKEPRPDKSSKNKKNQGINANNAASVSAIQSDEDKYVQEMVNIIKQLRA